MLKDVALAIEECSAGERAKLARFFATQAESKQAERPGASRILSWLGVVAAGRQPHDIALEDIPPEDRRYVRDVAQALARVVRDEAVLQRAETPADLDAEPRDRVLAVWEELDDTMHNSLQT